MKNILMLAHQDDGQEGRFQAALDVVRAVDGHLTCLDATPFVPFPPDAYSLSNGGVALLEARREVEAANRADLESRLRQEGVAWDWVEVIANPEAALESAAALADLVVVNLELPDVAERDFRLLSETLAVKSGKPVLAVGVKPDGFAVADAALVAWDGSDPAAAAMIAATPLLTLSESVTIVEVDDGTVEDGAETAAAYLSRHGIHAEIVRQKVPERGFVEPVLLGALESGRYGWAVMGAFAHSRIRETIFGGVTKRMLKESPIPLLIAH